MLPHSSTSAVSGRFVGERRDPANLRLSEKGRLKGAGDKPVSAEKMELESLRAENARLRMERDILGKATAYCAKLPQ